MIRNVHDHYIYNMRKKLGLLFAICLQQLALLAQVDSFAVESSNQPASGGGAGQDLALAQLRKDIVAHSPEAEAMAKYDVLPVNFYTGMPTITIPLYELKTPSLTLPFALSYNYNGYRPNEMATWAGLGWSVQGGGVITRMVKGQVDENMTANYRYDAYASMLAMIGRQPFCEDAAQGEYDTEPDLYVFNACGYSGKFILFKGQAYLFPQQNIQISPYGDGFRMVDDKGNTYMFTEKETTFHKDQGGTLPLNTHTSAWYVTSITSADKKDVISFNYQSYTFKQPSTFVDSYTINGGCGSNTSCHSFSTLIFDGDHIDSKLLTSVTSNYGSIYFIPSTNDRLDLPASTGDKMLDLITILPPGGGQYFKRYRLTHSYFGTNTKLRLDKMTLETSSTVAENQTGDPTEVINHWDFEYENNSSFPAASTRGIDIFGYANGATGNAMLFPAGTFSPSLYSYGDRSVHEDYLKLGMLKKMTYPTGGYSAFTWELNKKGHYNITSNYNNVSTSQNTVYSQYTPTNGVAKGYKNFTLTTEQDVTVHYSSDDVDSPVPTIQILKLYVSNAQQPFYTSPLLPANVFQGSTTLHLMPGDYMMEVDCQQGYFGASGAVDYRDYIIDNTLAEGPGMRIKEIAFFDNAHAANDPALLHSYTYNEGVELSTSGISGSNVELIGNCAPTGCAPNYVQTTYQASAKSALSDLTSEQFYYKEATEVNRDATKTGKTFYTYISPVTYLGNVKPETQTEYQYRDGDFVPLKKTSYEYITRHLHSFSGFKVGKVQTMGSIAACSFCAFLPTPDILQPVEGVLNVYGMLESYDLGDDYALMTQQKEILYDNNGQSAQQNQTDIYYDNLDHQWPTRTVTTNSLGEQIITEMKYPLDYHFGTCSTPSTLAQNFYNGRQSAIGSYSNCIGSLLNALGPYQPYHDHTSQFSSVVGSYHCEDNFYSYSTAAINNRNSALTSYLGCLDNGIVNNPTDWKRSVVWMQRNNVVSPVIEKYISVKKADNSEYLLAATRNDYHLYTTPSNTKMALPMTVEQVEVPAGLLKSTFLANPDNYYKPQLGFDYSARLTLSLQAKTNDVHQSYLWDFNDLYPVAAIANAEASSVGYSSFEGDSKGGFSYGTAVTFANGSITGHAAYQLTSGDPITRGSLEVEKVYIVSYWSKNGAYNVNGTTAVAGRSFDGWTYYEHEVTPSGYTVTISGTGLIDEVRLYPKDAQMVTYTYEPMVGISSQCDASSHISYYEYDNVGRLVRIRDQNKNILKAYNYTYAAH